MSRRVTFILPHGKGTSGGVYVATSLARELAKLTETRLLLLRRRGRPDPTVKTLYGEPGRHVFERGERVLIFGDAPKAIDLAPAGTKSVLFLQGVGAGNERVVEENLEDFEHAVVVSSWLERLATEQGCATHLARPGLDRATFSPGPDPDGRRPSVAMLLHPEPSKRSADGIAALGELREQDPDLPIVLFGPRYSGARKLTRPLRGFRVPTQRKGPLSRPEVAALLREVAVFASPSELEGFGLPGLEALASRAALATTDSRGSRDYALAERTALVSPPGEPGTLAQNVRRLLDSPELRGRLGAGADQLLAERFSSWSASAASLFDWFERID